MARLKRYDALVLIDQIEIGEVVYTLDAELAITGCDKHFEPMLIPEPTNATPGTSAKIEVLRQRVERGEHLWHPTDGSPRLN